MLMLRDKGYNRINGITENLAGWSKLCLDYCLVLLKELVPTQTLVDAVLNPTVDSFSLHKGN